MKYRSLLSFFLFIQGVLMAQQPALVNKDVAHPDSLIVFNGHVNHFRLTGVDDLQSYGLAIKNGLVSYTGSGTYLIRNLSKGPVQISVFRSEEGSDKQHILYTRTYRIEEIGVPSVQLIREEDETLSNHQTVNRTRLEPIFPNKNYGGPSDIAHFELTAIQPDGSKLFDQLFVSGEYLGIALTNTLKKLKKGGKLHFTQVVLHTRDGDYQKLADFSIEP